MSRHVNRLDAPQTLFFERQLENVEASVYRMALADLKARSLVPPVPCPPTAEVHTYSTYSGSGRSKRIAANDMQGIPRAEASAAQTSTNIQRFASSFAYTIFEIQAAAAAQTPLEELRAFYARRTLEEDIDDILATGNDELNGLLTVSANEYTLANKAASGTPAWGVLGSPNATALEIVQDLLGIVANRVDATNGKWEKFTIVLPLDKYNLANSLPLGDDASLTPIKFVLANSQNIDRIIPWTKCSGAAGGGADRMVCYPMDPMVLGALVPQDFAMTAPQLNDLEYKTICHMSTGGVILRYPVAMCFADDF